MTTDISTEVRVENSYIKYIKKNAWKLGFFASVFVSLCVLNLLFAPMMRECSNMVIAMLQGEMDH